MAKEESKNTKKSASSSSRKSTSGGKTTNKKTTKSSSSSKRKKTTNTSPTAGDVVVGAVKAASKSKSTAFRVIVLLLVIAIVALCVYGYFAGWFDAILHPAPNVPLDFNSETYDVSKITAADMSIHFLELGNKYTGDSIYIKAGDNDILIDAGSRTSSISTIEKYVNQYCTDGKLEYVIATHADQDHISGFAGDGTNKSLLERFAVGTFIDFALTNKDSTVYNNYKSQRERLESLDSTKVYTALECVRQQNGAQKVYQLTDNITMEVLEHKFYSEKGKDENDYSVCLLFSQGKDHYLLTGDLEEKGEESLVEMNPDLPQCVLFKAGHHGSKTSSNDCLLEKIKPQITCVCCCTGSDEYKAKPENTFPTQAFIDRISKYTASVYCTSLANETDKGFESMNGNIVFAATANTTTVGENEYKMYFSNNDTKLKDTDWFKNNRTTPDAWKGKEEAAQ